MKNLANALRWIGDRCFDIGLDWPAEICYETARKLGAKLEWPEGKGPTKQK